MAYLVQRFNSINDVPREDWTCLLRGTGDLYMNPQFISAIEDTVPGRYWAILVYDESGQPVGSAMACLYPIDAALLCPPRPRRVLESIRRMWPSCLRFWIVFCGLAFSAGQSQVRIARGADSSQVLRQLDKCLRHISREVSSAAIIWKEFTEEERLQTDDLLKAGYVRGQSLPMNQFAEGFHRFDEFCGALRSHYRYKVNRSQRKFARAGFNIEHFCGAEAASRYTDEVHRLYLAVARQADVQLEILPAEFFRQWALRCGYAVRLTAVSQGRRIVAFAWGVVLGETYQNVFVGLDYQLNAEYDLYFNLMASDLDWAMQSGAEHILMGQTTDTFKSRLGCYAESRYVYVKGARWFTALPLRVTHKLLLPPPPAPPVRHLFRELPGPPSPALRHASSGGSS